MPDLQQNNASNDPIPIICTSGSSYVASNTPTIKVRKAGAAAVSATGTVAASDSAGVAYYTPSSTDVNTIGSLVIEVSGTGIDSYPIEGWRVTPDDPRFRFPAVPPGGVGGLPVFRDAGGAHAGTPLLDANVADYGGTGDAVLDLDDYDRPVLGTVYTQVLGNANTSPSLLIAGVGARVFDANGNAVAPASVQNTINNNVTANGTSLTTLTGRLTVARAGFLDNLNVGGPLASHADIAALNQSASRTMTLACVAQMEPGESYTIEMHTYNRSTGASTNADTTPTLTAVGAVSGSLAANLTGPTNPSTAIYQWTYTVPASPTLEQIRFGGAATVAGFSDTLGCYSQTVDEATVVFTATDQSHLTSIFNKLPAAAIGDATAATQAAIKAKTDLIATNNADSPATVTAQGSVGTMLSRITGPVMLAASYVVPPTAAQNATAVWTDTTSTDFTVAGSIGKVVFGQLGGAFTAGTSVFTVAALANAPQGSGGGGGTINRPVSVVQRNTIVSD